MFVPGAEITLQARGGKKYFPSTGFFLVILLKNKNIRIQPDTIKKLHAVIHQRFFLSNWLGRRGVFGETKEKVLHCAFYFPWNLKTSIMLVFLETGEGIHPHKIHRGLLACSLKMQNYCFCKWATKHLEVVKVNVGATIWAHINNSYIYIKKKFFRSYEWWKFSFSVSEILHTVYHYGILL